MDIYLDSASVLPSAFVFNIYADNAGTQSTEVEVDFSNYQSQNGVQVPFHIQRYVAGNLGFDFTITGIQFNSGLSDSQFAIQ